MTLSDLEADLYRRLGKNTTADTVTQTRLRAFLNQRQRRILSDVGMGLLRQDPPLTFASVASQQRYGLPQGIAKIHRIFETTNDRTLHRLSLTELREYDPDPPTGTPDYWVPVGYGAVAQQPSNASAIYGDSTSASDTQNLTIEGILSTGERRTVTQALTGTTGVQIGSLSTWVAITRVYLATAALGTVTLTEDSEGGTELARITIGRTAPRYPIILLYPTPSAAITYTVDADVQIADMSVAGDESYLPEDFHYLLVFGAMLDEWIKTDDPERYDRVDREYREGIMKLKWFLHHSQSLDGPPPARSNLGAQYPAGVW